MFNVILQVSRTSTRQDHDLVMNWTRESVLRPIGTEREDAKTMHTPSASAGKQRPRTAATETRDRMGGRVGKPSERNVHTGCTKPREDTRAYEATPRGAAESPEEVTFTESTEK